MASAADDPLAAMTAALHLQFEPQDWGIANADGARVEEFIAYYETHPEFGTPLRHVLGELIVASMNEALQSGGCSLDTASAFEGFLARRRTEFPQVIAYWSSLSPRDFPVARLVRS